MILYCATTNLGKLREFRNAAPDFDIRQLPVPVPAPEETKDTFEGNAAEKALYYGRHVDGFLFADDSGLDVDALDGAPGIHSARFAGPHATDEENNKLLLDRLRGVRNRTARFVCALALVRGGNVIEVFRGSVEGRIIDAPKGPGGFGYDPLFFYEPFGCTFGEATHEQKMRVSHRAQALQKMFAYLRCLPE